MTTRTVSVELQAKVDRYAANMERAAQTTLQADKAATAAQKSVTALGQAEIRAAAAADKYGAQSEQAARANANLAKAQARATASTDRASVATTKAAAATDRLGKETDQTTAKVNKADKASRSLGVGYAIGGAAAALALKHVVGAASAMNESVGKSNVVFGASAAGIQQWASTAAQSMGVSEQAAIEATGTFGNLFVSMKLGQPQAANMSKEIVKLGSDLASFNNTNPAEALDALRAGLVGETEPLRRYGINLNDAALRQEALNLGLVKSTKDVLPAAAKAQASYSLIMQQSKTAQGDFARTSDGLANSQRIFAATLADTEAQLGQALLPAFTAAMQGGTDLLGLFNALGPTIGTSAVETAALGAAYLLLAPKIRVAIAAMREMNAQAMLSKGALGAAGLALTLVVTNIYNGVKAFDALAKSAHDAGAAASKSLTRASMAEPIAAVDALNAKVTDLAAASGTWDEIADTWERGISGVASIFHGDGLSGGLTGAANTEMDRALQQAKDYETVVRLVGQTTGMSTTEIDRMITAMGGIDVTGGFGAATAAVTDYYEANVKAGPATKDAAAAIKVQGQEGQTAADRLAAYNTQLQKTLGLQLQLRGDARALEAAYDAASKAVKENGRTLDITTEKGRSNADALDAIAGAAMAAAEGLRESTGNANAGNAVLRESKKRYIEMAEKMGLSETAAKRLADKIYGITEAAKKKPPTIEVKTKVIEDPNLPWYLNRNSAQAQIHISGPKAVTHATGGYIAGPGSSTSDSIPARLSNGEYVVQASAVSKYGVGMLDSINARGFATGGRVDLSGMLNAWKSAHPSGTAADVTAGQAGVKAANENTSDSVEAVSDAKRNVSDTRAEGKAEVAALRKEQRDAHGAKAVKAARAARRAGKKEQAENLSDAKEAASDAKRNVGDTRRDNRAEEKAARKDIKDAKGPAAKAAARDKLAQLKKDNAEELRDAKEASRDAKRNVSGTRSDNKAAAKQLSGDLARAKGTPASRRADAAKMDKLEKKNAEDLADAKESLSDAERGLADSRKAGAAAQQDLAEAEKRYQESKASPAAQMSTALGAGIKSTGTFIKNLQSLAARGYGDLAAQLLAQGGPEAEALAASAMSLPDKDLGELDTQVGTANAQADTLASMPTVFTILGALAKNPRATAGELARLTGISIGELQTAGATAKPQIKAAGGDVFLADMKAAGFARGGPVRGRGTATSDGIAARLSNGEYVISAGAAASAGRPMLDRINAGTRASGGGTVYAPTFTVTNRFDGITDTSALAAAVEDVAATITEQAFAAFDTGSRHR